MKTYAILGAVGVAGVAWWWLSRHNSPVGVASSPAPTPTLATKAAPPASSASKVLTTSTPAAVPSGWKAPPVNASATVSPVNAANAQAIGQKIQNDLAKGVGDWLGGIFSF